jgi:hypothetical protein
MNDFNIPKVLVCAPTAAAKNYCFEEWIQNVIKFTYPNFDIMLSDNTVDKGKNAAYLQCIWDEKYKNQIFANFNAVNPFTIHSSIKASDSVIERMATSHNHCRSVLIAGHYDYMLHLETDVFPEPDIIESLMGHGKPVVGAVYYRDEGIFRKPTLQRHCWLADDYLASLNLDAKEDLNALDGKLKQFASVGLGCVLIHKDVFQKIKFRSVAGRSFHPDSYFSEDCFLSRIPIHCDTSCIARHENKVWGRFGVDFK